MCKGSGSTGVSNQSSSVSIPPEVLAHYNEVWSRGQTAADQPFQNYSGAFVAPVNATQAGAIGNISSLWNYTDPWYQQANDVLNQGVANAGAAYSAAPGAAQPFNQYAGGLIPASVNASNYIGGADIGRYMSPYNDAVVQATLKQLNQQQGQQQNDLKSNLVMQGAYGGDRAGVARAVLSGQQNMATASTVAGLENQNYAQALAAAQQQQQQRVGALQQGAGLAANLGQNVFGQGLAAGQAWQGLGTSAANTYAGVANQGLMGKLQQAQAQLGAGTLPQQTEQADLSARYNQWLQGQAYPFQTTQFLANIAEGTGALSGSTTNQYAYQPQPFFSDDDLKEDVHTIGHTKDGLRIVRYKLKDDPHKLLRIGFLASDVEQKMPEAVTRHAGVRAVDYDRAARARGGGVAPSNDNLREGYAAGGDDMAAILAAHQAMYPGAAGRPGIGTGPRGMELRQPARQLLKGSELKAPPQQESELRQAMRGVKDVADTGRGVGDLYKAGKEVLVGSPGTRDTPASGGIAGRGGKWDPSQGWLGGSSSTGTVAQPAAATTGGISSQPLPDLSAGVAPVTTTASMLPLDSGTNVADLSLPLDYGGSFFARRGGRMKRAMGGGLASIPYATDEGNYVPQALYEPIEPQKLQAMGGSGTSGSRGGGSGLSDLASTAGSIASIAKLGMMFLKNGGRADYEDGGSPDLPAPYLPPDVAEDLPPYDNVIPFRSEGVAPRSRSSELPPFEGVVPPATMPSRSHDLPPYERVVPPLTMLQRSHDLPPYENAVPKLAPLNPTEDIRARARLEPLAPEEPVAAEPAAAAAGVAPATTVPPLPAPVPIQLAPSVVAPAMPDDTHGRILMRESGNTHWDQNGQPKRGQAGEVGAGQIMPGTGPIAAKDAGVPWNPELFYRPKTGDPAKDKEAEDYNRTLSAGHFNALKQKFDGDEAKAAAAYNAGEQRVRDAVAKYGAGWMQGIPDSTRQYVAAVTGKGGSSSSAPNQALNVPAPSPPSSGAGVVPAAAQPADRDFFDRAGDWWDRNEKYVIPALSFLGNMLSSPSRTLAGSIGSGLVGAAQAVPQQQRLSQEQQRIDIARNAQYMNQWAQLRQIYNTQIANNGQADPQIVAQMGRLAGLIGIGAPDGKTPVGEAAPGGQNLPAGGPGGGVAPSAGPSSGGVVPPAPAAPSPLPTPIGPGAVTSAGPDVTPTPAPVVPGQPADVPPSEKLPTVDFPPGFLGQLAPTANPVELRRRAAAMTDPGQAAELRRRADQVQAEIIKNGGGQGNAGFVPLPSAGAYRQSQERIADNVAWATAQQPVFQQRQVMRNSIDHIAKTVETLEPGALADYKAEAQALASALGVAPPNTATMNATEFQSFIKNARNVVLGSATGDQKTDAARQILAEGFADPHLQPKAVQRILAQALGNLDAADDYYKDVTGTLPRVPHLDRSQRASEFNQKNPIEGYYKKHEADLAVRGATPSKAEELTPGQAYIVEPSQAKAWHLPDITKPTKLRFKGVAPDGRLTFGRING